MVEREKESNSKRQKEREREWEFLKSESVKVWNVSLDLADIVTNKKKKKLVPKCT